MLAAGVFMNAVLAVALFATVAMVWGTPEPGEAVVGDVVEEWVPSGAAALTSIEAGTRIVRVGGHDVANMDDVAERIMRAPPGPLTLELAGRPPVTIEVPDDA
ncbi:MAG: hypothetical protein GWN02_08720, partial [Gemmatimonadetes bacterium]|nr:hypothetical protein [Gemmatimonadota bacterium]